MVAGFQHRKTIALVLTGIMVAIAAAFLLAGCISRGRGSVTGPVIDNKEAYHVIVAGGEPEGVAAALAAARNGMKTLLVEENDALGGLMTFGMLNFLDMNNGPNGELLTRGIFEEFYNDMGNAFDIEEAKAWFMQKCRNEPNITVMLNTEIVAPVMDGHTITGVVVRTKGKTETEAIRSLAVIDATVDGDVAAAAGAPYTTGGEDHGAHGRKQGVTLVFEVAGVDWNAVSDYLKNDGNPDTGVNAAAAWGYGAEAKKYEPADADMRFRGPNIARQKNGNVLLNALIIFGVDALDRDSYSEGIARGEREIPHIIEFMCKNFVGFENASFAGNAPRLYVRETRHFRGEYRLTITDVLENRDHWDRIAHGSYPVDLQPTGPDDYGSIIGVPDIYSIPFRCVVPLEIDQILIASRSASYDSLPHGSARVIPVGMAVGEACGTAVAYSAEHDVTFRQMAYNTDAILWLQNRLISSGAYIVEYDPPRMAVMDHWAYPGVAVMRELAMAAGGYSNDYQLENELTNRWALQNRLNRMMLIINERTADRGENQVPAWEIYLDTDEITTGLLLLTAAQCAALGDREQNPADQAAPGDKRVSTAFADAEEALRYLSGLGVIKAQDISRFRDLGATASNGQLFSVLGGLYTYFMEIK